MRASSVAKRTTCDGLPAKAKGSQRKTGRGREKGGSIKRERKSSISREEKRRDLREGERDTHSVLQWRIREGFDACAERVPSASSPVPESDGQQCGGRERGELLLGVRTTHRLVEKSACVCVVVGVQSVCECVWRPVRATRSLVLVVGVVTGKKVKIRSEGASNESHCHSRNGHAGCLSVTLFILFVHVPLVSGDASSSKWR